MTFDCKRDLYMCMHLIYHIRPKKLFWSQVDSANKQGLLLEMVQVLTDIDLVISKSYISSDGGWLMDGE